MKLLRPDLLDIPPYRRPAEPEGLVRLHMNEAPEDWPQEAKDALLTRLGSLPFNQYPERQAVLTERLQRRLGAPEGGVLLGPSSGALLDLVALAGLSPGDEVAVPEPGFSLYPLLVKRQRGRLRQLSMGTAFPLEPWFQALDCRQLWITLPNNPTGAWVGPSELEPLLEAAAARPEPPLIILDEAYAEFAPLTHRLSVDRYPNVLLLRTFSKALASASWRLGYLVGNPDLVARLSTLQLPYSLPSASLEALDVALDFSPLFEARIRELTERRDRLAQSLPAFEVAPSHANFLHIAPDPALRLREAGQLVRALPGTSAARVGVGTEAVAAITANVLGGSLRPVQPRPRRRLLALDVDGVLIEADRSFMEAVTRALVELMPGITWSDDHFRAFKRMGSFNNDFRLTAAAWTLAQEGQLERIFSQEGGFPEFEARFQTLEPEAQRVVQRHYADTCKQEKALIELHELEATGLDLAILTGRPPEELLMAFEVLGWRLPAISDAGPHLRKPEPAGLLQLADAFRAEEILFVGDTRDDAEALRRARTLRPELTWTFAAVGPDRGRFAAEEDLQAPTLRDLLPMMRT